MSYPIYSSIYLCSHFITQKQHLKNKKASIIQYNFFLFFFLFFIQHAQKYYTSNLPFLKNKKIFNNKVTGLYSNSTIFIRQYEFKKQRVFCYFIKVFSVQIQQQQFICFKFKLTQIKTKLIQHQKAYKTFCRNQFLFGLFILHFCLFSEFLRNHLQEYFNTINIHFSVFYLQKLITKVSQAEYLYLFNPLVNMEKLSETQIQNYTLISKIGQGATAQVILAKQKSNKSLCVLKMIEKTPFIDSIEKQRLIQEKQALSTLNHPFLIKMYQAFQTRKHFCLALEYCPGGDLYTHLHMSQRFTEEKISFYAAQLVLALEYLHQNGVIFRDLKPQNILIAKDGYLKLIDFGMAKLNANADNFRTFSICGTSQYTSPEILEGQGHGKSFDWWTLGCCLYEMLYKVSPFYSDDRTQMYEKILNQEPVFDEETSEQLKDFILNLLQKNSQKRMQFVDQIKSHKFFSGVNFENLVKKQYPAIYVPEYTRGKKMLKVVREEVQQFTNFETSENSETPYLQEFDSQCGEQEENIKDSSNQESSKESQKDSTDDDETDSNQCESKKKVMIGDVKGKSFWSFLNF